MSRATVVTGDVSPLYDTTRDQPLTQTREGRLRVETSPATGTAGLTDTQLRNTPVPVSLGDLGSGEYETVAASQTDQILGVGGAIGDYLSHIVIIPATAAAGAVSIKDGSGSAITIFAGGGTTALPTLAPFAVALGVRSLVGGWKVTTGANVSVIGVGNFT